MLLRAIKYNEPVITKAGMEHDLIRVFEGLKNAVNVLINGYITYFRLGTAPWGAPTICL